MAAVSIFSDLGAQGNKVSNCFHYFPIYLHEMMGSDAMILVLWMLGFKSAFSLFSLSLRVSYLLNGSDGKVSVYNAGDPGSILG